MSAALPILAALLGAAVVAAALALYGRRHGWSWASAGRFGAVLAVMCGLAAGLAAWAIVGGGA